MVVLALLASIEFYEDVSPTPQLNHKFVEVNVPANGLCFWACLWLGTQAYTDEIIAWFSRPRNQTGFTSGADGKREEQIVWDWVSKLAPMPKSCHDRVAKKQSAEKEDIETQMDVRHSQFYIL